MAGCYIYLVVGVILSKLSGSWLYFVSSSGMVVFSVCLDGIATLSRLSVWLFCLVLLNACLFVSSICYRWFAGRQSSSCLLLSLLLNRVSNWFACLVDPLKFTVHEGQKV